MTDGGNAGNSNEITLTTNAIEIKDFANSSKTSSTATFTWTAAIGATSVVMEQSPSGANTWASANTGTIANNETTATVTGLSEGIGYDFRLVVTGGVNTGISNVAMVTTNSTPTDISLSNVSIAENVASGTTIGVFTSTDPDARESFTYSLVSGDGSTDNTSFTVVGNELKLATAFDFETKSSYSIRVRVTDAGGLNYEEQFTIEVTDVNEAGTASTITPSTASFDKYASSLYYADIVVLTTDGSTLTSIKNGTNILLPDTAYAVSGSAITMPDKEWTVKFSEKLDYKTVTEDNVYVIDSKGNKIEVKLQTNTKSIKVIPVNYYNLEETYTLFITKNVRCASGKAIEKAIKYEYTIGNISLSGKKIKTYTKIAPTKVWTIELGNEIDADAFKNKYVTVVDQNCNKIKVKTSVVKDSKVKIKSEDRYKIGNTYYVIINGVKYEDGKMIEEAIWIKFQ